MKLGTFTFHENPIIESIYPNSGNKNGGTIVEIVSWNILVDKFLIRFDQVEATVGTECVKDDKTLSKFLCKLGSYDPGIVNIEVSLNSGVNWHALDETFEFYEPLTLIDLVPNHGPITGSKVTIHGTNFYHSEHMKCK